MVIGLLLVAAVVVGGLYVFVPKVHTALLNAWTVARDDLDKLSADGKALVARFEAHAASESAKASAAQTVVTNSTANASAASSAAAAIKTVVSSTPAAAK